MAGVSDRPFRQVCRAFGAGLVITEMVSSKPELQDSAKSRRRQIDATDPEPRAVQLLGNDPNELAQAARQAVAQGAQLIDLNLGCPAKKVCKKAAGSALMAEPVLVEQLLRALVAAVDCPVTLKMRTGPTRAQKNAVEIARRAVDAGVQLISIHGRSRADQYTGEAEYDTIAEVVAAVPIPIFANGDITEVARARAVLEHTGAAGVMIGRGAFGRPWLFAELRALLTGQTAPPPPTVAERFDLLRQQIENIYQHYGESLGMRIARKHLGWYAPQLGSTEADRAVFNTLTSAAEQRDWLTRHASPHAHCRMPL
ncbi:tRNA dihydrouridine synthase DusB [Halothiobacillus sp. DCM-1]|uniref:tRNA dihydrouridine synthase DusB n=1 Tax=Halothiobacillus sp. DCM-1 TaxID=3112558 RepID=UPI003890D797